MVWCGTSGYSSNGCEVVCSTRRTDWHFLNVEGRTDNISFSNSIPFLLAIFQPKKLFGRFYLGQVLNTHVDLRSSSAFEKVGQCKGNYQTDNCDRHHQLDQREPAAIL